MLKHMLNTLNKNKGFTLTEILVVLAILTAIGILTPVLSMDGIRTESFNSEIDKIATILQKARLQSHNNINQRKHGLLISNSNGSVNKYILFEGNSYILSDKSKEVRYEVESPIHLSELSKDEIIFEQLSGRVENYGDLIFENPETRKTSRIKINYEGQISW